MRLSGIEVNSLSFPFHFSSHPHYCHLNTEIALIPFTLHCTQITPPSHKKEQHSPFLPTSLLLLLQQQKKVTFKFVSYLIFRSSNKMQQQKLCLNFLPSTKKRNERKSFSPKKKQQKEMQSKKFCCVGKSFSRFIFVCFFSTSQFPFFLNLRMFFSLL